MARVPPPWTGGNSDAGIQSSAVGRWQDRDRDPRMHVASSSDDEGEVESSKGTSLECCGWLVCGTNGIGLGSHAVTTNAGFTVSGKRQIAHLLFASVAIDVPGKNGAEPKAATTLAVFQFDSCFSFFHFISPVSVWLEIKSPAPPFRKLGRVVGRARFFYDDLLSLFSLVGLDGVSKRKTDAVRSADRLYAGSILLHNPTSALCRYAR